MANTKTKKKVKKLSKCERMLETERARILEAIDIIGKDRDANIILLGNPPECVEAIVGIDYRGDEVHVVYSETRYILGLMKANGWSLDEAREWYEFNTVRGLDYMTAPNKPIIIDTDFTDCI